jgi:hypothetical protein
MSPSRSGAVEPTGHGLAQEMTSKQETLRVKKLVPALVARLAADVRAGQSPELAEAAGCTGFSGEGNPVGLADGSPYKYLGPLPNRAAWSDGL